MTLTPDLSVTLRGQTFTADDATDLEASTLISLFFPGADLIDPNNPEQVRQGAIALMQRLSDPIFKAKLAHSLTSLFPALPSEWVNFQLVQKGEESRYDFRFKLTMDDLTALATAVGGWVVDGSKTSNSAPIPDQPEPVTQNAIAQAELPTPELSAQEQAIEDVIRSLRALKAH